MGVGQSASFTRSVNEGSGRGQRAEGRSGGRLSAISFPPSAEGRGKALPGVDCWSEGGSPRGEKTDPPDKMAQEVTTSDQDQS
jgi:hypothetical protein